MAKMNELGFGTQCQNTGQASAGISTAMSPTYKPDNGFCFYAEDHNETPYDCGSRAASFQRLCKCEVTQEDTVVEAAVVGADDYAWVLGDRGVDCSATCEGEDLICSAEDDWGVNDEASFNAAMRAAGQDSQAQAGLCHNAAGAYMGEGNVMMPGVSPGGGCYGRGAGNVTSCRSMNPQYQRLCRCQAE